VFNSKQFTHLICDLKTSTKKIDRGLLLKVSVETSGMSVTNVVKRVGVSRSTYYNHVNDPNLPIDILFKYGRVLNISFNELLGDLFTEATNGSRGMFIEHKYPRNFEESITQLEYWRNKYWDLHEKYMLILEIK